MAREYVPIFHDWVKVTEELDDAEKGRLIDAIVLYAIGGDWQSRIQGNERFLFPAFREQVNRNDSLSKVRAAAGAVGGTANGSKEKQAEASESKTKQIEANSPKEKEKEEVKEKEKENKKEIKRVREEEAARFDKFWAAYPRKEAKPKAQAAFFKLHPDDGLLAAMLDAIERQKASDQWQEAGGRFIPYPASWLNNRRWEDQTREFERGGYSQRSYAGQEESMEEVLARLRGESA